MMSIMGEGNSLSLVGSVLFCKGGVACVQRKRLGEEKQREPQW